ncbi:MAG: FtsW/RodA/SpoVE family cell cycle protein [Clostridiaceae bacterium]|nr:FtsW/RodA/SpoVE family cell cycle protein [Clostridiaceae bacterium]
MNKIYRNNNNQYNLTVDSSQNQKKVENTDFDQDFMKEMATFRRIDYPLFLISLVLICFGLIILFSASMSTSFATQRDNTKYYFVRQTIFSSIGLMIAISIANFVPIKFFQRKAFYKLIYFITTIALAAVLLFGSNQMGAQRWITIFGIQFQPSEIAKFVAVYFLAGYFSEIRKNRIIGKYRAKDSHQQFWLDGRILVLYPALLMGLWLFLIVLQPHLSGALIFGAICFMVFVAARIPWKAWLSGILQLIPIIVALLLIVAIVFPLFKDGQTLFDFVNERFAHSKQRIETFSDEDEVSEDQSYQTRQAEITMGTGGLTGVGLGKGKQKYNYLPQIYNDYIFPAIAEELGYIGTMTVLILFVIQFILGVRIAIKANNLFSGLIAWGYSFLIILQVILNVGVSVKIIPTTGITLPFFSYGGTSNIIFIIEIGMILCVSKSGQLENKTLKKSFDRQGDQNKSKNIGVTTR